MGIFAVTFQILIRMYLGKTELMMMNDYKYKNYSLLDQLRIYLGKIELMKMNDYKYKKNYPLLEQL